MWYCVNCGANNSPSALYCVGCGKARPTYRDGPVSSFPDRATIKEKAKAAIRVQNKVAIKTWLIFWALGYAAGFVTAIIFALWFLVLPMLNILVLQILNCGEYYSGIKLYRHETLAPGDIFQGFSDYGHLVGSCLCWNLVVILWNLIPVYGIIKYYSYSLTPYVLVEHPEMSASEAMKYSEELTDGHKMELFVLDLSFIGWKILSALTFGILGILYVSPYYTTAWSGYFVELVAAHSVMHTPAPRPTPMPRPEPTPSPTPAYKKRCGICGNAMDSSTVCPYCGGSTEKRPDLTPSGYFHPPKL